MHKMFINTSKLAAKSAASLFAMLALVGCPKPVIPEPEPEKPTTETTRVSTTSELDTAVAKADKPNHTHIVEFADDMFVTEQTDNSIGRALEADASRKGLEIKTNGKKIYYGPVAVDYHDYKLDTKSFPYGADKNGKYHFAIKGQGGLWNDANIKELEYSETIKLTAENAVAENFYKYVDMLLNKHNAVNLDVENVGVQIMDVAVLDKLSSGRINIVDSNGDATNLDIEYLCIGEWNESIAKWVI